MSGPVAVSDVRWREAQVLEAAYWAREARNPTKLARDLADWHGFLAGLMGIAGAELRGATVLDIAGGPYPLGAGIEGLGLLWYAVLDPAEYPPMSGVEQIRECAEDFANAARYDEVWGYNVLQHVRDPAAVMATARRCAERTVRWFDVVETKVEPIHPHSITADWLRAELTRDGFRITRDIDGSRVVDGYRQRWVALVAERTGFGA